MRPVEMLADTKHLGVGHGEFVRLSRLTHGDESKGTTAAAGKADGLLPSMYSSSSCEVGKPGTKPLDPVDFADNRGTRDRQRKTSSLGRNGPVQPTRL